MVKEMRIVGITIDPVTQSPIVILRDRENLNTLPIWIGILEANAIAVGLEKVALPRPMTHDLIKNILDELGMKLLRIEVTDIRDSTYYASLYLESNGKTIVLDSRPSDAMAIALRTGAPIMVRDTVMDKAVKVEENAEGGKDRWSELLEKMDPEDFSKYKM